VKVAHAVKVFLLGMGLVSQVAMADSFESIFGDSGFKVEKIQTTETRGLKMDISPAVTGKFAVQAGVGTTGIHVGGTYKQPNDRLAYRAELSQGSISRDYTDTNTQVGVKLKNTSLDLLVDYHVFSSRFRLTAGLTQGTKSLDGNGTYQNGLASSAVTATAKFPSTMPYLGLGFSSTGVDEPGLGFHVDLGAYVGKPKGDLTASDPEVAASADFQNERARYRDDLGKLKFYPVVKLGANYRF
jgi:hypothetical protein